MMRKGLPWIRWAMTTLMLVPFVACDSLDDDTADDDSTTVPTVESSAPLDGASDVYLNEFCSATFSVAMDGATVTSATFTLTTGDPATTVQGSVMYAESEAFFWPAANLASDTTYVATITVGVESAGGVALAQDHSWTFSTGDTVEPGQQVNLGMAGDFVILAKAGISTAPTSAVTGDMGISPAAATYITGFSLTLDASNEFSTSAQVTGDVYASDYAPPTPVYLTSAIGDMELALTAAAGRAPDVTELGAGDIGGMTLYPGVYRWGTGLLIPTDVTLVGTATDVWVFQIAQGLTVASGVDILLTGGAVPQNVFWQVSGFVDLDTTAHLEGVVLAQTAITLRTGASITGRLLSQTTVDIDGSAVVEPAQ